ncbi:hypothetical protein [Carnobacterium iners]|uniref:hypothetical protein n=1 Tax=Carnobacterium iners TaxID=1073423 RepID=UPI001356720F|nr:hypothetical protein [Carnobacterium iners]
MENVCYSGKSIALSDIVYDFTRFEVDHIIPLLIPLMIANKIKYSFTMQKIN